MRERTARGRQETATRPRGPCSARPWTSLRQARGPRSVRPVDLAPPGPWTSLRQATGPGYRVLRFPPVRALRLAQLARTTPVLATLHREEQASRPSLPAPEIARRLGADPPDATDPRPLALIAAALTASRSSSLRPGPPATERNNCPRSLARDGLNIPLARDGLNQLIGFRHPRHDSPLAAPRAGH